MRNVPEWDDALAARIRKMVRDGATPEDVSAILPEPMNPSTIKARVKTRYGLSFMPTRNAHAGTSKLSLPAKNERLLRASEARREGVR